MPQHEQPPINASPRRAVVTGSAGFIGSHLAHALVQAGTTVIGVDRRDSSTDPTAAANLAALRGRPGYHHVTADLLHCAIGPLLIDADTVFHLADIPGVRPSWGPQFGGYLASNVLVAVAVTRHARACPQMWANVSLTKRAVLRVLGSRVRCAEPPPFGQGVAQGLEGGGLSDAAGPVERDEESALLHAVAP
ncbi:NAD-dependent epimerase/dehydratase family protein [Streptomyces sp. NPDC057509]|uniref:NAD-dependent epimerase/dehydratase family protein n=1 Tax=Streptomyces sp. NPDC057509 TaxID=3346152 RepID=UPI0036BD71C5